MNQLNAAKAKPETVFSTHSLVTMAMFAAILCISAYISIPLPNGSHITFLNFIITLVILLFPISQSVCIVGLWLLMGCVGLPVFIGGNAGIGYLFGPFGGYSAAFFLCAIFIPLLCGKNYQHIRYTCAAIISVVFVDLMGTFWMMVSSHMSFPAAFIAGFLPFIVLDLVKAVIAAQIVPAFQRIIHNNAG